MRRNFDKLKTVVISLDLFQNSGRIIDYEFAYVNLSKIWQLGGTHRGNLFAYVNLRNLFLVFIQATLVSLQASGRLYNNLHEVLPVQYYQG